MTREYFECIGFIVKPNLPVIGGRHHSLNFKVGVDYTFVITQFSEHVRVIGGNQFIPIKGSSKTIRTHYTGMHFAIEDVETVELFDEPLSNSFKLLRQMAGDPIMDVIKSVLKVYYQMEAV